MVVELGAEISKMSPSAPGLASLTDSFLQQMSVELVPLVSDAAELGGHLEELGSLEGVAHCNGVSQEG